MSKLITLEYNNQEFELWGLVSARNDKRLQDTEFDYIPALLEQSKSANVKLAEEAKKALIWLDAFSYALFHNRFARLEKIVGPVKPEIKRKFYAARNGSKRDFVNNFSAFRTEPSETEFGYTLGTCLDDMRDRKAVLKKAGKSVAELYKKEKVVEIKPPIKRLKGAELEQFKKSYQARSNV